MGEHKRRRLGSDAWRVWVARQVESGLPAGPGPLQKSEAFPPIFHGTPKHF